MPPHAPALTPTRAYTSRQRGISLIELMIALLLGLVVLGGVVSLYLSSHAAFRTHEAVARLQENGRFALEFMAREIRETGMTPCGSPLTANVLVARAPAATPWWADTAAGYLRGGEANGQVMATGNGIADHVANTDSLLLLRPASDEALITPIVRHDPSAQKVMVTPPASIRARDIVLMCDSRSSALWQVGQVNQQNNEDELLYGASPLNCASGLGQVDAGCAASVDKSFPAGALLVPWDPGLWYVGMQANGQRALYRARVVQPAAGAANPALITLPIERIPGVSNLQIEYLTRDRTQGSQLANGWVDAQALAGQWANPAREVIAVRLTLTLQAEAGTGADGAPLERKFSSVIALRNREP